MKEIKKLNILRVFGTYAGGVKNDSETMDDILFKAIDGSSHIVAISNFDKRNLFDNAHLYYHEVPAKSFSDENKTQINLKNLRNSYFTINNIIKSENIDLVHLHNPHKPIGVFASVAAKNNGVPLVSTYHGSKRWFFRDNLKQNIYSFFPKLLSDKKTVVSEAGKYLMGKNAEPIFPPVNHAIFSNKGRGDYFKDIAGDRKVIFYPARLVPMKGQKDLLYAAKKLRKTNMNNHCFVLAGLKSNKKYYEQIKDMIDKENLSNVVKIIGDIQFSDMSEAYNSCQFQVFPTYEEGLGKIIVEAGLCMKPTVGYSVGGVSEIISNNKNGFIVEPGNVNDFANRISLLLNDEMMVKSLGFGAFNSFRNNFRAEQVAEDYLRIYSELVKN